jgi:translation initiation factor IF-1
MSKKDMIQTQGRVIEVLPGSMCRVQLQDTTQVVLAYLNGRMKKNSIEVLEGDRVDIEISVYDLTRGRVTYRHRSK